MELIFIFVDWFIRVYFASDDVCDSLLSYEPVLFSNSTQLIHFFQATICVTTYMWSWSFQEIPVLDYTFKET